MNNEEGAGVYYGTVGIALILTVILLTVFCFGVGSANRTQSVSVKPEPSATMVFTAGDFSQLRREVLTPEAEAKAYDQIAQARHDVERLVQERLRDLEMQRQKEQIDVLLAVQKAEIERVRQEVALAEAERQHKRQEAIATALSQLAIQRQGEAANPAGAQRTSASF